MPKLLILFSDTGGGHRAAAEALRDAIYQNDGSRYEVLMEDVIVKAAVWPFNLIPKTYLPITQYASGAWGLGFAWTNANWGKALLGRLAYLVSARGIRRLFIRHDPDVVLTVHPLLTYAPWRTWKELHPDRPFITVVTDLFDAHATWFSAPADLLVVPTEGARERGLRWGFPPERMRVVGLPVSQKFALAAQARAAVDARAQAELRVGLGLVPDIFTVLVVGGGEGMGRLDEITRALAHAGLPIQLAVIAGRNETLRKKLEAEHWPIPVRVTGFVMNMPDWMQAADVVVTKAGPGTIMETLTADRPLLISGYLPGQEKGNVDFVEKTGVGAFAGTPEQIVARLRAWTTPGNHELEAMRARAREQARPAAALEIARLVDQLLACQTAPTTSLAAKSKAA